MIFPDVIPNLSLIAYKKNINDLKKKRQSTNIDEVMKLKKIDTKIRRVTFWFVYGRAIIYALAMVLLIIIVSYLKTF